MKKRTHRWINGTRGAISLLLAALMLPFFSLAAVLVEAGRYQSAVKALDEVLGSSAISTLANYDGYLLDRFGLLSISQDKDPSEILNTYFSGMALSDLKAISLDGSPEAVGQYPLTNLLTLRRQVLESSKYTIPAKVAVDFLNIEDLIKKLEEATKLVPFLDTLTKGSDAVGAGAELLEALDGVRKSAEKAQEAINTYGSRFSDWQSSINSLASHLSAGRPEDEEAAAEWDSQTDSLRDDAESARQDYIDAINDLTGALDDLQQKVETEMAQEVKLANDAFDAVLTADKNSGGSSPSQGSQTEDQKIAKKNADTLSDSVSKFGNQLTSSVTDCINSFQPDKMASAIRALDHDLAAVTDFDTDSITGNSTQPDAARYHTAQVDGLADADALNELLDTDASEMNENGLLDFVDAIMAAFENLLKIKGLYDGKLVTQLDMEYYETNYGGLPSTRDNGLEESRVEKILGNLSDLASAGGELSEALVKVLSGDVLKLLDMLKAIAKMLTALVSLIFNTVALLAEMGIRIVELVTNPSKTYEHTLIFGYMAYNLPNRTNYDKGTAATGYSYSKLPYGEPPATSSIPLSGIVEGLKALQGQGHLNKNFSGAELEYILWGYSNEMANQSVQFIALYLVRLLLNLPTTLTDEEIGSYAAVAGPFAPVIWGIYIFAEPLADTLVLVNGGDIPIIKGNPYLTVGGIPDLIGEFTELDLTSSEIQQIESKINSISGFTIYQTNADRNRSTQTSKGSGPDAGSENGADSGTDDNTSSGVNLDKDDGASSGVNLDKDDDTSSGVNLDKDDDTSSGVNLDKDNDTKPNVDLDKDDTTDDTKDDSKSENEGDGNKGNAVTEYLSDLLELNYTQYSFLMMMLFGSEDTCLVRLSDLIQTESTAYRQDPAHADLSERVLGTYKDFSIDESYTSLQVTASGSLVQLLPVPALSSSSMFRVNREIYRGY